MYYLLLISGLFTLALDGRAVPILLFFCFFFLLFFCVVQQAFKRRFCSGICHFSMFLLPIMLRFGGSKGSRLFGDASRGVERQPGEGTKFSLV